MNTFVHGDTEAEQDTGNIHSVVILAPKQSQDSQQRPAAASSFLLKALERKAAIAGGAFQ